MGVEGVEANAGIGILSCSLVNTIGGNNLKALKRPNKGRKYNGNIFKDRDNRAKRLALLNKCPNR